MLKIATAFASGIVFTGGLARNMVSGLTCNERIGPFGVNDSLARIQHDLQDTRNSAGSPKHSNGFRSRVNQSLLIANGSPTFASRVLRGLPSRH